MKAQELKKKYLDFFVKKGHKIIPAAPLVPEDDPTTLFTSSGMQQLVPYLKGKPHRLGKRLVDNQPCLRLQDIEKVGDTSHTTFFEMLGNWSLGYYFKKEQLDWFFSFLINEINLDPTRLYVSIFKGDKYANVPRDSESEMIWTEQFNQIGGFLYKKKRIKQVTVNSNPEKGIKKSDRIFYYGADENWWSISGAPHQMPIGEIGGPDSEVFYDFGEEFRLHEKSAYGNQPCHPNCPCGRFLEIGNNVFIEYEKGAEGFMPLPQENVDFGGGLERLTAATNNNPDVFQIDLFLPIIRIIEQVSGKNYKENERAMRIIADHLRAASALIMSNVLPSNKEKGYVLRRLIRRSALKLYRLGAPTTAAIDIIKSIQVDFNHNISLADYKSLIEQIVGEEVLRFNITLEKGLKELNKTQLIDGKVAFYLFQTFGFPWELTAELVEERSQKIDYKQFEEEFKKHQKLSRTASAGMFKGGLANHSEIVTKYHTATHLLNAALRQVLGSHVFQKGSNITAERLRFDFPNPEKLTEEEIKEVENLVNQKIKENLPVEMETMPLIEAQKKGAMAVFGQKYGEEVKTYRVGSKEKPFSFEVCGGPHVPFTGELGKFKIIKEEAVGSGTRRLYGILE